MPVLLVVEDEPAYREFLGIALNLAGYEVRAAASGQAAIESLSNDPPALALLDLSMPHVSGWDVLRFMRAHADLRHIPVLLLTANADEQTRRRAAAERADEVLIKPVSVDEILAAISLLLEMP